MKYSLFYVFWLILIVFLIFRFIKTTLRHWKKRLRVLHVRRRQHCPPVDKGRPVAPKSIERGKPPSATLCQKWPLLLFVATVQIFWGRSGQRIR